jgi:tetratricopeptide (TPR) repeat protein
MTTAILLTSGCGSTPAVYLERGNHFFENAKYDDAEIEYQKAIQKSPKLGEAHYRLALVELQKSQPVPAYRELQRAVELMPGNTVALAKLGQLALSIYNVDPKHPKPFYDQAAKSAVQLAQKDQESFETNLLQGALDLVGKKPADAVGHLRKAVARRPDDNEAKLGLARALVQNDQAAEGLELARNLIGKDKTFSAAYDFLFEQYSSMAKPDEALSFLKLKSANNPKQAAYLLQLARYYAATRKPAEVTATIERLVNDPADFPGGIELAGDFYLSVGQPADALRFYERGMASKEKDKSGYRKRIIRLLVSQRKWPEASLQAEALLKEKPGDEETKLVRAYIWLDEGKPENLDPAISEIRAQLVKRPHDPALHYQLGNALTRKHDPEGARRAWTAAAQDYRSYAAPRVSLAQLDLSENKVQQALTVAEEVVAIEPQNAQAHLLLASSLTAAGQYPRARVELNRLVTLYPQSPQVRFRLGLLDLSEGKYKEAEDIFRRFDGASAAEPEVLAGLAQAYQGQNESSRAVELLQAELKRKPDTALLRRLLASFAVASRNYDLAAEQFQKLAEANPKAVDVQLSLASAYAAKGDSSSAVAILKKAIEADPKSVPANLALAQTFVVAGRIDEAKVIYRRLLQIQPGNANALNDLAYLMADTGENVDEALAMAQRGLQNANSPSLKTSLADTLGWIYLKKNMNDSALQTFQSLVHNNPGSMTYRYHLGMALYQKGDTQGARTELQTALSAKPASSDEQKIRELLARLENRS